MKDSKRIHIEVTYPEMVKVEKHIPAFQAKMCEMYYNLLIENIKSNKFGFTNVDKKNGVPLIESGAYLNSITFSKDKVYVGGGAYENGLTFTEISDILEYGRRDKHIPAFPVWQLTLKEFIPIMQQEFKTLIKSLN